MAETLILEKGRWKSMRMGEMHDYTMRFLEIRKAEVPGSIKDLRIANLLSDLEEAYQIPIFRSGRLMAFELENPLLMQFYRTVSEERSFE